MDDFKMLFKCVLWFERLASPCEADLGGGAVQREVKKLPRVPLGRTLFIHRLRRASSSRLCIKKALRLCLRAFLLRVAERQGFEPWVPKRNNGFRDRPDRPLRHLSLICISEIQRAGGGGSPYNPCRKQGCKGSTKIAKPQIEAPRGGGCGGKSA